MHPILEYLLTNTVASLEARGVYARWSTVHPEKFSLNYDQIEAVDSDELTQYCRGLVVVQDAGERGESGTYRVVGQGFNRFFNYGQGAAAEVDFSRSVVMEKLDGTCSIVYWYGDQWNMATRSVPDADIAGNDGRSFASRFWEAANMPHNAGALLVLSRAQERGITCLFEFCAPDNQIVVAYDETRLVLLAMFDPATGEEVTLSDAECQELGVHRPTVYPMSTYEEIAAYVGSQPGIQFEGVVAWDPVTGARVKIKNPQYLAVARILTNAGSNTGLMTCILGGTADDIKPYLPAPTVVKLEAMETELRAWSRELDQSVQAVRDHVAAQAAAGSTNARKDAALFIQGNPTMAPWLGQILNIWMGKTESATAFLHEPKMPSQIEKLTDCMIARMRLPVEPVTHPANITVPDGTLLLTPTGTLRSFLETDKDQP